jgi:hypothetical protein
MAPTNERTIAEMLEVMPDEPGGQKSITEPWKKEWRTLEVNPRHWRRPCCWPEMLIASHHVAPFQD